MKRAEALSRRQFWFRKPMDDYRVGNVISLECDELVITTCPLTILKFGDIIISLIRLASV